MFSACWFKWAVGRWLSIAVARKCKGGIWERHSLVVEWMHIVVSHVVPVFVKPSWNLLSNCCPKVVVSDDTYINQSIPSFDHLSYRVSTIFYCPLYSESLSQSGLRIPQPWAESQQKQHWDLCGKTSHLLLSTVIDWQAVVTLGRTLPQKKLYRPLTLSTLYLLFLGS